MRCEKLFARISWKRKKIRTHVYVQVTIMERNQGKKNARISSVIKIRIKGRLRYSLTHLYSNIHRRRETDKNRKGKKCNNQTAIGKQQS